MGERIEFLRAQLRQRFDVAEYTELQALEALGEAALDPSPAPHVTGLDPGIAVVGGPDLTLYVFGSYFTPATVILFNGGEEPTTYVSDTEVTTLVKPSTASGPYTVPVSVVGAAESVEFTFTG